MNTYRRIFIIGPVGSGKSTLGRRIQKDYGFAYQELDSVIYTPYEGSPTGNRKRPEEEQQRLLAEAMSQDKWVMEDAGRLCFEPAWQQADVILLLDMPSLLRKRHILSRWIKQRLGLEPCGYRPTLRMLGMMFRWTKQYNVGKSPSWERMAPYLHKMIVLHNQREVERFIAQYLDG